MTCLIIDDEPLATDLLRSYVQRVEGLQLIRCCANAVEAMAALRASPIDLVFLDIQMPKISGIDLLKSLSKPPKVIFTTAFRDYAVEAFDLDVADYLVKPISFERFLRALRAEREMVKVYLKEILYIESLRDYVRVRTVGKEIISYNRIGYLEQKLPENKFIRVHRSYIVALDRILSFTPTTIRLQDQVVPIGRNYKNETCRALNRNNILFEPT